MPATRLPSCTRRSRFLWVLLLCWQTCIHLHAESWGSLEPLRQQFLNPPETTKPRCYWYWLDDHVSKEGITRDLESMRRVGIGAAYVGMIGGAHGKRTSLKPAPMSPEWWGLLEHAVSEGTRLGVDIGMFNCPGWSQSGGPWIRHDQTMRYLVRSEIVIDGPLTKPIALPLPTGPTQGPVQTVAVQAYPAAVGEGIVAQEIKREGDMLEFEATESFVARSLQVHLREICDARAVLQVSDDGTRFRKLREFRVARTSTKLGLGPDSLAPVSLALPPTKGRFFRLQWKRGALPFDLKRTLGTVELSAALRIEDLAGKTLAKAFESAVPPFTTYTWPAQAPGDVPKLEIDPKQVVRIDRHLLANGQLDWKAPPGKWVIQWTVLAASGTTNKPAPTGAVGPEVDKLNAKHVTHHLDSFLGTLHHRLPAKQRASWKYVIADSYETGLQNWTDDMAAVFQRTYGYDPIPFLPAITGRVVGSVDQTERFLWDLRRLVADRVASDYVGTLRKWSNARGMRLWLENYGHFGFPSEFLLYGGNSDEISGEFWLGSSLGNAEVKSAASACHIYGKPTVWAEAFTSGRMPFHSSPRDLKARGDWAYCQGINQFVLHVVIHQPTNQAPGLNAWFGTEFNRNNPWFERSDGWIDYQRRCSVMLQAGLPVADFAVFITEDCPKMVGPTPANIPAGHDYDEVNADVLLHRMSVVQGRLTLPNGINYAALILPDGTTMRPAVAKKIQSLAQAGAKIIGRKPSQSPSLQDYPRCDAEVRQSATWQALESPHQLQLSPDVRLPDGWLWKHRRTNQADIYFISNQHPEPRRSKVDFRLNASSAALWNPVDGTTTTIPCRFAAGRTELDLSLPAHGSIFVLFSDTIPQPPPHGNTSNPGGPTQHLPLTGPWTVSWDGKQEHTLRQLGCWTQSEHPELRYQSGPVLYQTAFQLQRPWHHPVLKLGRVESVARIKINGIPYPALWTEPYQLTLPSLPAGRHVLEVEVTHTQHNRLIGNAIERKKNQSGVPLFSNLSAESPLQPSGWFGPVELTEPSQVTE